MEKGCKDRSILWLLKLSKYVQSSRYRFLNWVRIWTDKIVKIGPCLGFENSGNSLSKWDNISAQKMPTKFFGDWVSKILKIDYQNEQNWT